MRIDNSDSATDMYEYPPHMDRRKNTSNRRLHDFETCPKYDKHELTEEQITEIAKKAVLLAKDEFYLEVGKSVTTKFFVVVGVLTLLAVGWMSSNGLLK